MCRKTAPPASSNQGNTERNLHARLDCRLRRRHRLYLRHLRRTEPPAHPAGLPVGRPGAAGERHRLRAGLRPGHERQHPCGRVDHAMVRYRFQSVAGSLRARARHRVRRRCAPVRPVVCGVLFPRRPAGIRLHRPARHLQLDLQRKPPHHRRFHPPQVESRRRALHQLQHPAGLGRHGTRTRPAQRTCQRDGRTGQRLAGAGGPELRLRRPAVCRRTGVPAREPQCESALRQGQDAGPRLPGARIFQPGLDAAAVLADGEMAGAGQAGLCIRNLPKRCATSWSTRRSAAITGCAARGA